jgi:hypothetical protein
MALAAQKEVDKKTQKLQLTGKWMSFLIFFNFLGAERPSLTASTVSAI